MIHLEICCWKFVVGTVEELVEGEEDVFVDEVVVGEVDDGWYDEYVEGFQCFFDSLADPIHGILQKILDIIIMHNIFLINFPKELSIHSTDSTDKPRLFQKSIKTIPHHDLH